MNVNVMVRNNYYLLLRPYCIKMILARVRDNEGYVENDCLVSW